jgi:type I restriction-modification system DNA methylase subunit
VLVVAGDFGRDSACTKTPWGSKPCAKNARPKNPPPPLPIRIDLCNLSARDPHDGNDMAPVASSLSARTRIRGALLSSRRLIHHFMFEQAFKNIDDVLRKEAGCTTELDYTEQTSWLLFLKYLDSLEVEKAMEAELDGRKYSYILDKAYRWNSWAAPKDKGGQIDHNKALSGDDLRDFVNQKLFPYLHGFKQRATSSATIEYKIGEIFGEIKNKIQSGYNLREIIDHVDELRFGSQTEKHELSHLYEAKIKNMGNAGRNGGEYYTPRPLIRAIIRVVQPKIGERIYDGAAGSAGFLCESFEYLRARRSNPVCWRVLPWPL